MGWRTTLILAAALGGCASGGEQASVAATGGAQDLPRLAQTVAAQLEASAGDAARLAAVELELRRISDALPPARAGQTVQTAQAPVEIPAGNASEEAAAANAAHEALRREAFGEAAAAPAPDPAPPAAAAETAAPPADYAPAPDLSGARSLFAALTLGSYPNADTARAAWFGMSAAHGDTLGQLDARMEQVERESGGQTVVLKAGPLASDAAAQSLCARLREAGAVCGAGDFTGEPL